MFYTRRMGMDIHYPPPPKHGYLYWGVLKLDYSASVEIDEKAFTLVDDDGARFDMLFSFPFEKGMAYPNGHHFHDVKVVQDRSEAKLYADVDSISDRFIVFANKSDAMAIGELTSSHIKSITIPDDAEIIPAILFGKRCYLVNKMEV